VSIAGIFQQLGDESTLSHQRPHLFDGDEEIVGRGTGPRERIIGSRCLSSGHLLEGEPATRLEHPVYLPVEPVLVRDVHADVLHPDGVERGVGEWQVERAAFVHLDPVLETGQPIQQSRPDAVVGR
jgi:hypothetical protein